MQVSLTPAAQADLDEIRDDGWIDSPTASSRIAAQILRACMTLAEMPNRGRGGRRPGTRELVVGRYVATYRVRDEVVEVIQIRHHARRR